MEYNNLKTQFKIAFKFYQKVQKKSQKATLQEIVSCIESKKETKFQLSESAVSQIFNDPDFKINKNILTRSITALEELLPKENLLQLKQLYNKPREAFTLLKIKGKPNFKLYERWELHEICEEIDKEMESIKIQETWMMDIRSSPTLKIALENAVSRNVKIEILLLHPNSTLSKFRSESIENNPEEGRQKIIKNLEDIAKNEILREGIQVRLYDEIPVGNLFIFSSKLFTGWYFAKKLVQSSMFLEIQYPDYISPQASQVIEHFETLWKKSEPCDLNKLETLKTQWKNELKQNQLLIPEGIPNSLEKFLGVWSLFYLENFSRDEALQSNTRISTVGRSIITLERHPTSPEIVQCRLKYRSANQERFYEGIANIGFKGNGHLILHFFDKNQLRYLNIILSLEKGNPKELYGTFNVIYRMEKIIGSGLAVFERCKTQHEKDVQPCVINPLTGENLDVVQNKNIINYLILRDRALLKPVMSPGSLNDYKYKECPYHGHYKIFAYGRIKGETCIAISHLEITPNHYIIHRKKDYEKRGISYGFVDKVDDNIRIVLENPKNKRLGVLTLHVGVQEPELNKIYCGTFSGISYLEQVPVCTLVVLQFIGRGELNELPDSFQPEKISIFSNDIKRIDPRILKVLTGRENNFIKFREATRLFSLYDLESEINDKIDYGRLFFESAVFNANQNNFEKSIKMMIRAINHGFSNLDLFEKSIKDTQVFERITNEPQYVKFKNRLSDTNSKNSNHNTP